MYKLDVMKLIRTAAAVAFLAVPFATSANATFVAIPDPSPQPYIYFGTGNASVTYSGVTFSQSGALSDGNFYNVGPLFSGDPAVLSSQQQTFGVANISVALPGLADFFSVNYGTFNGSSVTFNIFDGNTLINTIVQGSTGSGYLTPDFFQFSDLAGFTSVLITSGDAVLNINNINYTAVPEPGTILLFGMGLLALGGLSLRRKSA